VFQNIFDSIHALFVDLAKLEASSVVFVILLVITVIVFDAVAMSITKTRIDAGFDKNLKTISVDDSKIVKEYISEELGLAGRPDAVIEENGFLIPVERKPLQKKIHERQVAQLLVYMRLIEHCEGKRPPYGILVLGKKCKNIKIENTPEKQKWLDLVLKDMHSYLYNGVEVTPSPHPIKCSKCPVNSKCSYQSKFS
jgi:CRISPR-associated protein Cas4